MYKSFYTLQLQSTTHTTSAVPSTTKTANSTTSGSSSRVRSGSNNNWDIFGLPPVATLPPPISSSKKYASKNSSSARPTGVLDVRADTDEDGTKETIPQSKPLTATAPNTATGIVSATTANKNATTVPIARRPTTNTTTTTAVNTLPDKRKYGQISHGIPTNTTSFSSAEFVVPSGQPSDKHRKANSASCATIPTTTTSTMHSTNATNSTSVRGPIAGARPTTTHSIRAAASINSTATLTATSGAATVLNKKKNKSVVSKDWFDEDAPF